jgi:dTDP-4-amino-4,6-dideoxygalactose transaminase
LTSGVPFFRHDLGQPELDAIAEVLAGPILTTGETVACFEKEFAAYLGRKHALGVTSCTGAMHMALLALGIGPGDEVITTPMTFVATAGAIAVTGAKPVFVDVEPDTGNIDASNIEAAITDRTKAILPVHLFGLMCDMRAIRKIADRHKLSIVEDSAHCIEGSRDGVRPGELSDAACFSFFATKNITCGEGGALVTNRDDLVEKLRLLRLHGMARNPPSLPRQDYAQWDMVMPGWKYNMDNIQAALLRPQMQRIDSKLRQRHALTEIYEGHLRKIAGVRLPATRASAVHAQHMYPVWVDARIRDAVANGLIKAGVGVVVPYRAIHLMSYFRETLTYQAGDLPVAERIADETIALPFYPTMTDEAAHFVVDTLRDLVERNTQPLT